MSDSHDNPPIRLYWDIAGEATTLGRSTADIANGYYRMARAAGRQAFAEAVARVFLGEPGLQRLDVNVTYEYEYDDAGGYFKCPTLFVKAQFADLPVNELQGQCEGYDPELVREDGLSLAEAVDQWEDVCRDVLEQEAGWIDEPDVWGIELSASRAGLDHVTRHGQIDLAAFWQQLVQAGQAVEVAQALPMTAATA